MSKYEAQLYKTIKGFVKDKRISFHMPVHMGGKLYGKSFLKELMSLDVTELDKTDNLMIPQADIKTAHKNMASLFGAKNAHILVGGSSGGIHAMLLSALNRGDKLLIDSCVHISVINACVLYGIEPVFIERKTRDDFFVAEKITPDLLLRALNKHSDARAVLITSPTYYGICSPVKEIAEMVHKRSMSLLVDCAHGSHFAFSDKLPKVPTTDGADMCVMSLHKTLGAPTQVALLLHNSDIICYDKLKKSINMIHTTSPSYMFMCAADFIIEKMARRGKYLFEKAIKMAAYAKKSIESATSCRCLCEEGNDLLRLVINICAYDLTGEQVAKKLSEKYKIDIEMADCYNLVCIVGPLIKKKDIDALVKALCEILQNSPKRDNKIKGTDRTHMEIVKSVNEAFFAESETVEILKCEGRVCADTVSIYPPGTACLVPGALISKDVIDMIMGAMDRNCQITGVFDGCVRVLKNYTKFEN